MKLAMHHGMLFLAVLIFGFNIFSCRVKKNVSYMSYPEFYRTYNLAENYFDRNKLDEGMVLFDSISLRVPHIPSSYFIRIAQEYTRKKNCESAAYYFKKAIENGQEYKRQNDQIYGCKTAIDSILKFKTAIHNKLFNHVFKARIDSMLKYDQNARQDNNFEKSKFVDSTNMESMLELIHKYGYPSEKIIGSESAFNAFIILLHMDRDTNNIIFKPILDKAYHDGFLSPIGLSWIVDRRRVDMEPYYYHFFEKKLSAEELIEVNRRRDSIGLTPR
jgi:hypothetical protein